MPSWKSMNTGVFTAVIFSRKGKQPFSSLFAYKLKILSNVISFPVCPAGYSSSVAKGWYAFTFNVHELSLDELGSEDE